MPKGRAAAPLTDEQKAEKLAAKSNKFTELATNRVGLVLERIRMIEPLSNTAAYAFTPAQVQQMYNAIVKQTNETFARFQPGSKGPAKGGFSFSEPVEDDTDSEADKIAAE